MLVVDVNPSSEEFVVLSGSLVTSVQNAVQGNLLIGYGHEPELIAGGWLPDVASLYFSGSSTYTHRAQSYLFDERSDLYDQIFSCVSGSFAEWTMFVVGELEEVPSTESIMLSLNRSMKGTNFPGSGNPASNETLVFLYASSTQFKCAVQADGVVDTSAVTLGTSDTDCHIFEVSADGAGVLKGWLDGQSATDSYDVTPKSAGTLTLGAGWYRNPVFVLEQLRGSLARVLIFDEDLDDNKRSKVRNQLSALYGVSV